MMSQRDIHDKWQVDSRSEGTVKVFYTKDPEAALRAYESVKHRMIGAQIQVIALMSNGTLSWEVADVPDGKGTLEFDLRKVERDLNRRECHFCGLHCWGRRRKLKTYRKHKWVLKGSAIYCVYDFSGDVVMALQKDTQEKSKENYTFT